MGNAGRSHCGVLTIRAAARWSSPRKEPRPQASAVSWLAGRTSCGGPLPSHYGAHEPPHPTLPRPPSPIHAHDSPERAPHSFFLLPTVSLSQQPRWRPIPPLLSWTSKLPRYLPAGNIGPSHTDCGLQRYGLLQAWYDSMTPTPALACSNHRPCRFRW